MEAIKIEGIIEKIFDVEKKSETFTVQRFWVKETVENYPQTYEVQCTNKSVGILNEYAIGQHVSVMANLNGRTYTGKDGNEGVFMTLGLWKIERIGNQAQANNEAPQQAAQPLAGQGYSQGKADDLPF